MKKHCLFVSCQKRVLCLFLAALVLASICGCEEKKSSSAKYYAGSERAVIALEDALYFVERCLDEKISTEECSEELKKIVSRFEVYCGDDDILNMAILKIKIIEIGIRNAEIGAQLGTESNYGVMKKVQEARDELLEALN